MRSCADSVDPNAVPAGLPLYAGYVNGRWPSWFGLKQRFPTTPVIGISVLAANVGDCLDVENGDATCDQAPGWVAARRAAGVVAPIVYVDASNCATVTKCFLDSGTPLPLFWIADYSYPVDIVGCVVGRQYEDVGPYDLSTFVDYLPGIDPAPVPPLPPLPPPLITYQEKQMLARNTKGRGYWAVRPSGAVYAYDGAPNIGPNPKYLAEWGIGTAENPVVGIVDDGAGGFVLEADRNQYPGQPALYGITADGRFRD